MSYNFHCYNFNPAYICLIIITLTVRARPQVPRYNVDIAEAKRRRRKAERRWRKTRLPEDLETFKRLKNHVTYISTKARRNADFMRENGGDQGRLFRATRALLPPKDDLCFPEYVDGATLANDIGRFFYRKIINIRTGLDAATMEAQGRVHHDAVFDGDQKLHDFTPLSAEEVKKLIQKSSKKSCTLDPMPTSLVVSVVDELLHFTSFILNSSLYLGYFPEVWKAALVDPRLKKSGQAASLTNLRPVSNLQFISKLTERAVCDQTAEHVSRSGLYPLLQSAYRAGTAQRQLCSRCKTISYWLWIVSTSPSSYFSIWVRHSIMSTTECCYVVLRSLKALRELFSDGFDHTWLVGPNECT